MSIDMSVVVCTPMSPAATVILIRQILLLMLDVQTPVIGSRYGARHIPPAFSDPPTWGAGVSDEDNSKIDKVVHAFDCVSIYYDGR